MTMRAMKKEVYSVRFQRVKSQRMVRAESLSDRGESMEGGGEGGRR